MRQFVLTLPGHLLYDGHQHLYMLALKGRSRAVRSLSERRVHRLEDSSGYTLEGRPGAATLNKVSIGGATLRPSGSPSK